MMVAVLLGALSLGACVDDNESASVTNIRNAKAEQLTALAEKARAEGEAAKILAEAEQAVKEAYAAWLNEQTSQSNQKFAIELEKIKAETEAAILEAQKRAQEAEQAILANANAHLQTLYSLYSSELAKLQYARQTKANYEIDKAKLEAGLGTIEEYIQTLTDQKNAEIAQKEAEKAAWENYSGLDKDELQAQLNQLNQQKYTAFAEKQTAQDDANAKEKIADAALEVFSTAYEGTSTVAAVAAIQKYEELAMPKIMIDDDAPSYSYEYVMYQQFIESMNAGLIDWSATEYHWDEPNQNGYYTLKAVEILYQGKYLFAAPTIFDEVALSEDVDCSVVKYALRSEVTTTAITQHYENEKANYEKRLGKPASPNNVATGLYAELESREATLATAQKNLTTAETAYTKAEQDWKKASDALETAKANETTAKTTYDNAVTATKTALAAYREALKGTDAAAITATKNAYDAAVTAETNALTAWQNAIAATDKAQTALNTAKSTYNTAESTFESATKTAQNAELAVAQTNDWITYCETQLENWEPNAAAWNAMVTAINSDDYATAIEGLKSNTDVAAYIAAALVVEEKTEAYNEINAQVNALAELIKDENVIDAAYKIAQLDKDIAKLKYDIENLPYDKLENGTLGDSKEYRERLIAYYETAISELEAEIAVQEKIVETYKAAVEDAINNGESTDTPAEDQPAA